MKHLSPLKAADVESEVWKQVTIKKCHPFSRCLFQSQLHAGRTVWSIDWYEKGGHRTKTWTEYIDGMGFVVLSQGRVSVPGSVPTFLGRLHLPCYFPHTAAEMQLRLFHPEMTSCFILGNLNLSCEQRTGLSSHFRYVYNLKTIDPSSVFIWSTWSFPQRLSQQVSFLRQKL